MNFVSVADACRHLGIDTKTLHRWLAEAELALQCHPVDGRKKGMREEHLQALAHLHHRYLTGGEQPAPVPPPTLPASLLALPEQLTALQAELVTLQQQVTALTRLLTESKPEPVQKLSATKSSSTAKPKAPPAPSAAAKTKAPTKPVHVIPRVEYDQQGHYVVICPKQGVLPFEPDSAAWFAWVKEHDSFRFVGKMGHFSAHHEWRVKNGAWRAHRHIRNRVYTQRLAPAPELTIAVLEQAAAALSAHLT
jgi:hypothetical protein